MLLSGAARAQFGLPTGEVGGGMGQVRPEAGPQGNGVRFQTVARGANANARPGLARILDGATLANYWRQAGMDGPMPRFVDWTNDQILIVHLGSRNTGGYAVLPGGLTRDAGGRGRLVVVEQTPVPGQAVTQALTNPYLVLAVDRSISQFDLVWTKRTTGGLLSVPDGTVIGPNGLGGNLILFPPLPDYGCGWYGGDYECYVDAPGQVWIDGTDALLRYNRAAFGNVDAVAPRFDWRRERLLAVHLGSREAPVGIETVGFERDGDRAVLTLRELPAPGARIRNPKTVAPFALVRVDRRIRKVEVRWKGAD